MMRGRFGRSWTTGAKALAAALLLSCGCTKFSGTVLTPEGLKPDVKLDDLLPADKEVESYRRLESVYSARKATFEQALGKERTKLYYDWHSYGAKTARYGLPNKPPRAQVTVIEFDTTERCYGAFTHLRPQGMAETEYFVIGDNGCLFARTLMFTQSNYMGLVYDLAPSPSTRTTLMEFARVLARKIPQGKGPPIVAAALPIDNRVPNSEFVEKDSLFGFRGVDGGATARYLIRGKESRCFVIKRDSPGSAKRLLGKLKDMCAKEGKCEALSVGEEGFSGRWKGKPFAAARTDVGVYGVEGEVPEGELAPLMADCDRVFRVRAPKKAPPPPPGEDKEKTKPRGPFSLGF